MHMHTGKWLIETVGASHSSHGQIVPRTMIRGSGVADLTPKLSLKLGLVYSCNFFEVFVFYIFFWFFVFCIFFWVFIFYIFFWFFVFFFNLI